jgi:hypothetical protein
MASLSLVPCLVFGPACRGYSRVPTTERTDALAGRCRGRPHARRPAASALSNSRTGKGARDASNGWVNPSCTLADVSPAGGKDWWISPTLPLTALGQSQEGFPSVAHADNATGLSLLVEPLPRTLTPRARWSHCCRRARLVLLALWARPVRTKQETKKLLDICLCFEKSFCFRFLKKPQKIRCHDNGWARHHDADEGFGL